MDILANVDAARADVGEKLLERHPLLLGTMQIGVEIGSEGVESMVRSIRLVGTGIREMVRNGLTRPGKINSAHRARECAQGMKANLRRSDQRAEKLRRDAAKLPEKRHRQ